MPGQVRLGQSMADVKLCRTTMLTEDIAIRHARPHSTADPSCAVRKQR